MLPSSHARSCCGSVISKALVQSGKWLKMYAVDSEESAALKAVMQLPPLIVQALAHALDYVRPLHMEAVLRYGASFKPFHDAHQMSLSPNALRWAQSHYTCEHACAALYAHAILDNVLQVQQPRALHTSLSVSAKEFLISIS